ncbi:hypothetical protein MALG_00624 [Marinovum algicola DG 898]|nr:hypothetical protein MALG_00624 [Marinovum algicola DG 898]
MSAFTRTPAANARSLADHRRPAPRPLAPARARRSVAGITVWSGVQSFPADHRYPLTCGRSCVSPSQPPASFAPARFAATPGAGPRPACRQSASLWRVLHTQRVTWRRNHVTLPCQKLLAKEARHESGQTESVDCGICVRSGHAIGVQPCDDRVAAPLIPSPLTTFARPPASDAPRGRFAVFSQTKKDHPCSTRS